MLKVPIDGHTNDEPNHYADHHQDKKDVLTQFESKCDATTSTEIVLKTRHIRSSVNKKNAQRLSTELLLKVILLDAFAARTFLRRIH